MDNHNILKFSKNVTGRPIFTATMSYKRFEILRACLRFDDSNTRVQRRTIDKAAPISEIFSQLVSNSQKAYCLTEYATVDEMLVLFRGRCSLKFICQKSHISTALKFGAYVMPKHPTFTTLIFTQEKTQME